MHVSERGVIFSSELFVNVTRVGKGVVVLIRRCARLHKPTRIHRTGRTRDDVGHANLLQTFEHEAHPFFIARADAWIIGNVASVVHAVACGCDCRIEDTEIIFQSATESLCRFTTPAELETPDVFASGAAEKIRFDEPRVQLLFRDRVTDDGDSCVRGELRLRKGWKSEDEGNDKRTDLHG